MWGRIAAKFKGLKTVIWSGFLVVSGVVVAVLQSLNVDTIGLLIPPKYREYAPVIAPALIAVIGVITGWLRYMTTTPIGSDQPETPPLSPKA